MPGEKTSLSKSERPKLGVRRLIYRLAAMLLKITKERENNMDEAIPTLLASGAPATSTDILDAEKPKTSEEQLIDALDEAALRFAKSMLDDRKDENDQFIIPWNQRVEIFKMCRDWVAVRRRTDISDPGDDQSGIDRMRAKLKEAQKPAPQPVEIDGKVVMPPPPRKAGRPSNDQRKLEQRYQRALDKKALQEGKTDDSLMQRRLAGLNGGA